VGYRLNRGVTLATELTWTRLEYSLDDEVFSNFTVTYTDTSRDVLSFTTNFRFDIPTRFRRMMPYIVAGGGVANDTSRFTRTSAGRPDPARPMAPITFVESAERNSGTYLALAAGGGLGVVLTDHVSIDVDVRALYLRSGSMGLIRIGYGGSYRF
jgi:opacity protein-like surface antigen